MFEVKENECVGFESKWKVKKVYYENSVQTTEYEQAEKETNTATKCEAEIQTENEPQKTDPGEIDMVRLGNFLAKVYPLVKKNIDEVNNSRAFANYTLSSDEYDAEIKILQTLKVHEQETPSSKHLSINALSWNSTGKSLAVSCNRAHKTWCLHRGFINIYTLDSRTDLFPEKPRCVLDTESCVTSLNYHPNQPSVIAAGTYSGDLYIWNTNNIKSGGNKFVRKISSHEDIVTQISWISDIDVAKTTILASSGLDGFLNLWHFNLAELDITVKEKYKFKPPVLAKVGSKDLITEKMAKKNVRGVICFDFSPFAGEMFVVGLEGGLVVQCSMHGTHKLKGSTPAVPISDPIFKYYEALEGEIVNVVFSPHRPELFMTNSVDAGVRIYIIETNEPAKIIFTENHWNAAFFAPNDEKLITGCSLRGHMEIFDMVTGKQYKNTLLDDEECHSLTQMTLSKKRSSLVVTGNAKGEIQLLYIPWNKVAHSRGQFI